jgi:hypothetical protein
MSILVNKQTKAITQGMAGETVTLYPEAAH